MAQPAVLVVSRDPDFAGIIADLVKKELAVPVAVAAGTEAAKPLLSPSTIIVTDENPDPVWSCPVLVLSHFPVKMRDVLEDIARLCHQLEQDDMALGQGYQLNIRQKQLVREGTGVNLTDKEVQLLQCLAGAGGAGASREHLLKQVWGMESSLDTHTLETHIYRLRNKFRDLSGDDSMIAAMNGGYVLKLN
jgi:hypothetical protein